MQRHCTQCRGPRAASPGFTLIELLVVVAIIALLISIILPSLRSAREQGRTTVCLGNQKTLANAFVQYAAENADAVVSSWTYAQGWVDWARDESGNYLDDDDLADTPDCTAEIRGIENGLLYPYAKIASVFHCPSDNRDSLDPYGGYRAYRTYSMPNCMNGDAGWETYVGAKKVTKKTAAISSAAARYVFLEESDPRGINMHSWVMYLNQEKWIDPLTVWHENRSTIGFADGHATVHAWLDERTINMSRDHEFDQPCPGSEDWRFMAAGWTRQER